MICAVRKQPKTSFTLTLVTPLYHTTQVSSCSSSSCLRNLSSLLYSVLGNRVHPHPQHGSCPAHKSVLGSPPLPLAPDLGFTAAVMRAHTGLFQAQIRHIPYQITRNRGKSQGSIYNLSIKQDTTVLGATLPIGIEQQFTKKNPSSDAS